MSAGADLLVHVVDGSTVNPEAHISAVRDVLAEIDADEVPQLLVFNKADLSDEAAQLVRRNPGSVAVSAVSGEGIDDLLGAIGERLRDLTDLYELFVPWARGDILAAAHREGEVLSETTEDDGMRLSARFEPASAQRLGEFVVRRVDEDADRSDPPDRE